MKIHYLVCLLSVTNCFSMLMHVGQKPTLPHIELKGHDGAVMIALFSPDNTLIASGSCSKENNLIIWQNETGQLLHNLVGHTKEISALAFMPNSSQLVSGSFDTINNLKTWCTQTGKLLYNLDYHTKNICAIDCNNEGLIISASNDQENNLALWNSKTGQLLHKLINNLGPIYMAHFSPDGETIISANDGLQQSPQTVLFWNTKGEQIKKLCYQNIAMGLAFNKQLTQFAASRPYPNDDPQNGPTGDALLTIWNTNNDTSYPAQVFVGHDSEIVVALFSPSGTKVVSSSLDQINNLILWDNVTGNMLHNLIGNSRIGAANACFSPDEHYLLSSGTQEDNLLIWDTQTGNIAYDLGKHNYVFCTKFSNNGKQIISASGHLSNSHLPGELILWFFDQASQ